MPSNEERLSVLETEMNQLQAQHNEVMKKLESLLETMTKYKGFIGGIMFALSAIGSAIGMVVTYWFQKN